MQTHRQPGGVFDTEQLDMFQRVFDAHCAAFGYRRGSPAAENIADVAMMLFRMGYSDEASLKEAAASRAMFLKAG